ncbi:histidine kinase [Aquabacterium sp. A3]|uniref:sensor histidine kinase n=1 Tax=Aquabacterium sp. A3 TaxID=3132829 RepID=UPI00311A04BF
MPRLALLNEILVWVGAISMHVTDVLAGGGRTSLGLPYQLLWIHLIGLCGLTINGSVILGLARRGWRMTPDMAERYAQRGVYLGLPARVRWQLLLGGIFSIGAASLAAQTLMAVCLALPLAEGLPDVLPPFQFALFNSLYGCLAVYAFEAFQDRVALSRWRVQRAEELTAQAQLDLLRSQLDPHMLFNTLANVVDLMEENPKQARDMVNRLIGFLRATLAGSRASEQALSQEFALVADYLSIMQIRMADRLRVRLDLPETLASVKVPALVLQPLVENAIEHGLAPHRQGGQLDITARHQGGCLVLEVSNTAEVPPASDPHGGFGLACVQQRLHALHGDRGLLELSHDAAQQLTRATVRVPLST